MSNFDFVRATLPQVHADAARAESYLATDPVAACFYARRVVEELVAHLYEVLALPIPYNDDLSARTNAAAFKAATGNGINQKLNPIRTIGNRAAHPDRRFRPPRHRRCVRAAAVASRQSVDSIICLCHRCINYS